MDSQIITRIEASSATNNNRSSGKGTKLVDAETVPITTTANLQSIPGIQYPILTITLYFRIVGVINSTG
jgi:hypothetical protein